MADKWSHSDLAADLVEQHRRPQQVFFREAAFGTWAHGGFADVASIRLSWTKPLPTIYEVKVSRADLLSDLRSEKWRRYLPWCERLYFAVPEGLGDGVDWPRETGLLERDGQLWRISRGARHRRMDDGDRARLFFAFMLSAMQPRHNRSTNRGKV